MNTEIKLTKEETARVFAMYLGCQCRNGGTVTAGLIQTCLDASVGFAITEMAQIPLSAISDEDAIEVARIIYPDQKIQISSTSTDYVKHLHSEYYEVDIFLNPFTIQAFYAAELLDRKRMEISHQTTFLAFQYLIQKGYAVPLFIAPSHPANGRTAIELGIAIDKTTQP